MGFFSCASGSYVREGNPPLESVANLDLSRSLGRWYEIARLPFVFEDGLVNTSATYSLQADGNIQVLNEGYRNTFTGKKEKARDWAWVPDPARTAKLKVSFFGPFAGGFYRPAPRQRRRPNEP